MLKKIKELTKAEIKEICKRNTSTDGITCCNGCPLEPVETSNTCIKDDLLHNIILAMDEEIDTDQLSEYL